ncbi:hypothetical protein [Streptomyces sp. TRM68367]|uniref:hypothetical protein n=1 Tax=Streptomyces sp. TRM68367 TaxID=2758415 RepID=UPI0019C29434|nr:hypothetical protein [Streptomyces sp. TRM68367]MBC9729420.1 hypothetical protein [Streptomyces sp. TRM68367]
MTYCAVRAGYAPSSEFALSQEFIMENSATGEAAAASEPTMEKILYSAELRHEKGKCTLTINDHLHGNVEVYVVPKSAVQKLPFYLAMVRSKLA